ncbi:MAG TPA: nitrilase-related carbon-nitrogen hydrolase, partial [Burkholderiaceae bacterium]|nr:nitrilase-related carbon-nitrogen hydrolase [Burkholderiaceae bacterium]
MHRNILLVLGAVAIGCGLRFIVDLEPNWIFAWFLPGLLLALALRADPWPARGLIALAAAIGVTVNVPFFLKVMPVVPVIVVMASQVLLWVLIYSGARRIVTRYPTAWSVLALPVIVVGADTLLAYVTPDGNWGSLAYTQTEALPVAQLAAFGGVPAILFVLMLANSAIALALTHGTKLRGAWVAYGGTVLVLAASIGFGAARLQAAPAQASGTPVAFGIAAVDDFVPGPRSEQSRDVWEQYDAQVLLLAGSGAKIIVLPEKIDVLKSADAEARKAHLAALARDNHVWLVAGLGVDNGTERRNEAWWFAPDGRQITNYLKHFMAPPEREFVSGSEYPVNDIEGLRYGVAICKDMHFARLGRGFGARDAGVMLVPAWDFTLDAEL